MAAISAGAMEVPVGLDGEASSTPRVCGVQAARTEAASSWKRAPRARPAAAAAWHRRR
jgi:hypothetical protein